MLSIKTFLRRLKNIIWRDFMTKDEMEVELNQLKERVTKLEKAGNKCSCGSIPAEIELEIELPEANISGLHFNKQTVRGVFESDADGNYYSRDILFHSARDTDDGTGRDLLSEYLESQDVKNAFSNALTEALIGHNDINIFLPKEKRGDGIKKYNGVTSWYWLKPRSAGSTTYFVSIYPTGHVTNTGASSVGGSAPPLSVSCNDTET
jgi:hypothetical protein